MTAVEIELLGGVADGMRTMVPADDAGKPPYAHCVAASPPPIDWTAPADELAEVLPVTFTYYRSKRSASDGVWRYKLAGLTL